MAEFCLECWNRLNGTNDPEEKYIFSDEPDFCEGCGEWKPVIVGLRKPKPQHQILRRRKKQ
ncbi:MAG: hypothetical protein ACI4IW_07095 [Oscillospiraceae bacterium]